MRAPRCRRADAAGQPQRLECQVLRGDRAGLSPLRLHVLEQGREGAGEADVARAVIEKHVVAGGASPQAEGRVRLGVGLDLEILGLLVPVSLHLAPFRMADHGLGDALEQRDILHGQSMANFSWRPFHVAPPSPVADEFCLTYSAGTKIRKTYRVGPGVQTG